jgi:hypothetical protein
MKRLIVGDIHGCHREFLELLELAGLSAGDEVIAVGDVVDRGRTRSACWSSSATAPTPAP